MENITTLEGHYENMSEGVSAAATKVNIEGELRRFFIACGMNVRTKPRWRESKDARAFIDALKLRCSLGGPADALAFGSARLALLSTKKHIVVVDTTQRVLIHACGELAQVNTALGILFKWLEDYVGAPW